MCVGTRMVYVGIYPCFVTRIFYVGCYAFLFTSKVLCRQLCFVFFRLVCCRLLCFETRMVYVSCYTLPNTKHYVYVNCRLLYYVTVIIFDRFGFLNISCKAVQPTEKEFLVELLPHNIICSKIKIDKIVT